MAATTSPASSKMKTAPVSGEPTCRSFEAIHLGFGTEVVETWSGTLAATASQDDIDRQKGVARKLAHRQGGAHDFVLGFPMCVCEIFPSPKNQTRDNGGCRQHELNPRQRVGH